MLAPLLLFVYNRVELTRQTLLAMAENDLVEQTELYIFSDGPKKEADVSKVNAVRELVHEYAQSGIFRKVHIKEASQNMGLANSVISGVSEVIKQYGKVIVLEDDLITSKSFLKFMNDCLNFYEDDKKVWSIGGTTQPLKALENYPKSIYACYRGESCGWATWLNRWERVDWKVSDYEELLKNRQMKKQFRRCGEDAIIGLKKQMEGMSDSWAIRWVYQESKEDMFTIRPKESLIKNIGFDGSGTHCAASDRFHIKLHEGDFEYVLETVEIEPTIMEEFRGYFERTLATKIYDIIMMKVWKWNGKSKQN